MLLSKGRKRAGKLHSLGKTVAIHVKLEAEKKQGLEPGGRERKLSTDLSGGLKWLLRYDS